MFIHFDHLVVSLMCFLPSFHVVTADEICADKPVFTPSRLVVKYGDATSATCLVCQHACPNNLFGLEKSVGVARKNGTTILWKVDSLTEWDINPMCYYTDDNDYQCSTTLDVTVYQPPKNVNLSLNHSGPMLAGHLYTLECTVQEVAPVGNLTVTFYHGQTSLGRRQVKDNPNMTPVSEIFFLDINPSKEDDGGQYWCEAKLDLGAEGLQYPAVVMSQNINATVHYKPQLKESSHPNLINVTAGNPLHLNCSAVGNPEPSYTWTLPSASRSPFNGSILTIESVTSVDEGQYICSVRNTLGSVTVKFNVVVQGLQLTSTILPPTTTRTTTAPNSSTSSILSHRFTMCLMLLFFVLV